MVAGASRALKQAISKKLHRNSHYLADATGGNNAEMTLKMTPILAKDAEQMLDTELINIVTE